MSAHNSVPKFPRSEGVETVMYYDDAKMVLRSFGTTVPTDATAGYATGCIFSQTDGSATTALYVNEGSNTSCDFNAVTSASTNQTTNQAFTGTVTTTDGVASGTARKVGGVASNLAAAGTALTASTTETVLASYTIPAGTLKAGTLLRVHYQGIVSATTGATTLTQKLRLGSTTLTGTAIVSGTATTTAASLIFSGYFDIVSRAAASAASALVAHGMFSEPTAAGAVTPKQAIMASTNFATNAALLLELTGQWSASDANSCRADVFAVEVIG